MFQCCEAFTVRTEGSTRNLGQVMDGGDVAKNSLVDTLEMLWKMRCGQGGQHGASKLRRDLEMSAPPFSQKHKKDGLVFC